LFQFNKKEWSYIFYDWAESVYSVIIMSAVLPLFFKMTAETSGLAQSLSTAYWGYANTIATILVAIFAPFLGAIADYQHYKKKIFLFFFGLGIFFTGMLVFLPENQWFPILMGYVLSLIGYSVSNLYYDAFLIDATEESRMDKVSTTGYAMGYIGGSTIPFVISILLIALHNKIGISSITAYRFSFLLAAVWWLIFALPLIKNVHQNYYLPETPKGTELFISSFKRLGNTITHLKQLRHVFVFLLAYFFYIDGVGTIIKMATVFGSDMGISNQTLLIIMLVTQILAFPFALLYGKLADRLGGRIMISVGIVMYTLICFYAYFMHSTMDFWILAILVATSQGGLQALSRSYYCKIIPKEKSNEFFGFYNIFGRFAAIMGPFLMGVVTQLTGNSRFGVFSIAILFLIGLFLFLQVPEHTEISTSNESH